MKRNNFGKIGVLLVILALGLNYLEVIDVILNGIINAIAFVFLSISLYDRITGKK
jgi:hypothetical protein|tara:strand:- start:600 stop:764 length:165 start_codon:yes stop_codon:yes gene_type:complete